MIVTAPFGALMELLTDHLSIFTGRSAKALISALRESHHFRDAFLNGNPQNFAILDDTSAQNGEGIIGEAIVVSFGRGEPLNDNLTTAVTLKSRGAPTWGTI